MPPIRGGGGHAIGTGRGGPPISGWVAGGGPYTFRLTPTAKHTDHLLTQLANNYTVTAHCSFFTPTIWARVPVYGEPLQQKKGTRPKNGLCL